MAEVRIPLSDNSNKGREGKGEEQTRERKDPIAKGKLRKRSVAMKFADIFFEGSLRDAIDYIVNDLAIPQVKNAVLRGLEVIFYGGARSGSSDGRSSGNTPYNSYYVRSDGSRRSVTPASQVRKQATGSDATKLKKYDPKLIVLEDRGQAQEVLLSIKKQCDEYGQVSVLELFDLVGVTTDWTSSSYGWVKGDLDNARVRPCPGGWCFDLPEPYQID